MGKARKQRARGVAAILEALEDRQMLAWGTFPTLIGQGLAAEHYPQYNGAGMVIVDLDSGVNFKHPALAGRIWTNPGEIPGNGIDDDGSGKIDDVNGWDFVNNDNHPADDQGHGTMTAGILVANRFVNTGNTRGWAGDGATYQGVAAGAKVIPLKVINSGMGYSAGNVEAALQWVLANHQRYNIVAVNMSLDVGSNYPMIEDEVTALWKGGVFIGASSGNGGNLNNVISWPAATKWAAAVGGINSDGSITSGTSRGPSLDLLAPGNKMPYLSLGTDYYLGGMGTSYAAPFAAGAAAVIRQVNPDFSNEQILQILKDSGIDTYDSGTRLTFKRINLDNAIDLAIRRRSGGMTPFDSGAPQSPFGTSPIAVPGTLQFENFDYGGQGISFVDYTAKNNAGAYRAGSVDVRKTNDSDAGYHVTDTQVGEWLEYTIDVASSGMYDLGIRLASDEYVGKIHIEVDGIDRTGPISVMRTGSVWYFREQTVKGVYLPGGRHVMRICMDAAGPSGVVGNFNWMTIKPSAIVAPAPGTRTFAVEAEAYSAQSGITRGSTNISYVDGGDWVKYAGVDFGAGAQSVKVRLALDNAYAGKTIEFRTGSTSGPIIGTLTTKGTGGWGVYGEQTAALSGASGVQDLYVTFSGGGGVGNIDKFTFTVATAVAGPVPEPGRIVATDTTQAESFSAQSGLTRSYNGLSYVDGGDWARYDGMDFGGGVSRFTVRLAVDNAFAGGQIVLRAGSLDGDILGTLTIAGTGGWGVYKEQTIDVTSLSGVHNLYLTFVGGSGLGNIDSFRFA